jgi:transmembrane sensor
VENTVDHIDDLIGKYLAGEATPEEIRELESWIQQHDENRKYVAQLRTIFERASAVTQHQQFDTDAAWNKVKDQLHKKAAGKTVSITPASGLQLFWKIAASIIFVTTVGFWAYRFAVSPTKPVEVFADNKPALDTLPDGSEVYLNKQTKLVYSFDKKENSYIVKLKGEAYFNIKHNDNKKFIVDAEGVFIKDIGTSFNVKAYPESNNIEVVVEEGEIVFYTKEDSGIHLRANGKGVYNKLTRKFTIENPEPNITAYKTKFFIFTNTDLATVVQTLNSVYDKKISIHKKLEACKLTVTFNDENIDEIANIIAETLNLSITSSGQTIVMQGTGCIE